MIHSFAYYRLWFFKFLWCSHHCCSSCLFGHVVSGRDMGVEFSWIECPFAYNEKLSDL